MAKDRFSHDAYGKAVLLGAAPDALTKGNLLSVYGGKGRIDGVIEPLKVVIEIESRTNKQIRGAIMDLLCHPYPNKLLMIIPAYNTPSIKEQWSEIKRELRLSNELGILTLKGNGSSNGWSHLQEDIKALAQFLEIWQS
jgi:hypothetical protein